MTGANFQVPPEGTGCRVAGNLCTMETPAPQDTYTREKTVSNTYDVRGDWSHDRLEASFILGKTKAKGGPSFQFYAQAKPRNGTVNGNSLSAWNFTDQSIAMQFSPDIIQNMLNGVAQIDLGSTGSGFTNSSISQRYAQVDVTRHFETFIDSLQLGVKWRDGKIHRETGRFEWYSDAGNTLRFQDTPGGALALPEIFFPNSLGNIAGGFETTAFPAINSCAMPRRAANSISPFSRSPIAPRAGSSGRKRWPAGPIRPSAPSRPISSSPSPRKMA